MVSLIFEMYSNFIIKYVDQLLNLPQVIYQIFFFYGYMLHYQEIQIGLIIISIIKNEFTGNDVQYSDVCFPIFVSCLTAVS